MISGSTMISDEKSNWSAPMWQGYVSGLPTQSQRRDVIETQVPESMRERVISHCRTVQALRKRNQRQ